MNDIIRNLVSKVQIRKRHHIFSEIYRYLKKRKGLTSFFLKSKPPLNFELEPVSRVFGFDRGCCIDRYYIEKFLKENQVDIHGNVLEIGEPQYIQKFGGEGVLKKNILHAVPGNPLATIIGNLETGEGIPSDTFDCMIITQTYLVLYDLHQAIRNTFRSLKPGGVLLATFPGISQISRYDMERWGDYWRFTDASAKRLFGDVFGISNISVNTYGNVLVASAFLYGLSSDELTEYQLNYLDNDYQVIITVRAQKPYGVKK